MGRANSQGGDVVFTRRSFFFFCICTRCFFLSRARLVGVVEGLGVLVCFFFHGVVGGRGFCCLSASKVTVAVCINSPRTFDVGLVFRCGEWHEAHAG